MSDEIPHEHADEAPEGEDVVGVDDELPRPEDYDPDPNPQPIAYSGTDFDVEGLVRRLIRGDVVIPTFAHGDSSLELARFQRGFVWSRTQMDRFIESLLLGYPIPGIFLVQQADKRYLVLDGQQRLQTLRDYYRGVHDAKEFALQNVAPQFVGLTYERLPTELRRTLDNTFIQATIVRTDGSVASLDAVYQVFERLNSGGTVLTAHEIRVALYAGPLIDWLVQINNEPQWRFLYGKLSPRLRDQELVLRVIALYVSPGTYKRPLKKYLNDFAALHRYMQDIDGERLRSQFVHAAELVRRGPGRSALRAGGPLVNAALTEAIFVGLMRRLDVDDPPTPEEVTTALRRMLSRPEVVMATSRATADEESVRTRLGAATNTFAAH